MDTFISYMLCIPAALIALTVHEYCHGYVAYRLGDPTAKAMGRLSLNPLRHLDPFGVVCMVLFGFGWARPVPIDPRYFKDPRKGMALSAAAGPFSNLVLALIGAFLYRMTTFAGNSLYAAFPLPLLYYFFLYLSLFFYVFHILNLGLCVFNLIPIPPLDGSRILYVFLPNKWYFGVMKYERALQLMLMLLICLGSFSGVIDLIVSWLSDKMLWLVSFIPT